MKWVKSIFAAREIEREEKEVREREREKGREKGKREKRREEERTLQCQKLETRQIEKKFMVSTPKLLK